MIEVSDAYGISVNPLLYTEILDSLSTGLKGYVKKKFVKGPKTFDKPYKISTMVDYNTWKRIEGFKYRIRSKSDYLEWIVKRIIDRFHKENEQNEEGEKPEQRNRRSSGSS